MSMPRAAMSVATRTAILALFKVRERTLALILRLIAVDGLGLDARTVEVARDPVCAVLGAGEHQNLVYIALTDDIRREVPAFPAFLQNKAAARSCPPVLRSALPRYAPAHAAFSLPDQRSPPEW